VKARAGNMNVTNALATARINDRANAIVSVKSPSINVQTNVGINTTAVTRLKIRKRGKNRQVADQSSAAETPVPSKILRYHSRSVPSQPSPSRPRIAPISPPGPPAGKSSMPNSTTSDTTGSNGSRRHARRLACRSSRST
jgi:hypothetical protein